MGTGGSTGASYLKLTLDKPNADLLQNLAYSSMVIVAKEAVDQNGDLKNGPTIGTGPWIFEDFKAGDHFFAKRNPDYWFSARLQSMWIPDAFIGPMASLMCAIEDNSEPESSGRDNLRTLQIVFAEYRSIAEKRAIRPDEITG